MLLETDKVQRLQLFGEDSSALVSTIEQSFGVKFSEDELVQATTLGELAHTVFVKMEHPVASKCLSAVTFYQLRRAFMDSFGIPRAQVVPAKSLAELMPWPSRRKQWRAIQTHTNLILPQLRWSVWLLVLWFFLTALTLFALLTSTMLRTLGSASALIEAISILAVLVLFALALSPLARDFPRNCKNFGDLEKLALSRNYGNIAKAHGLTSEETVVHALLVLVAAETSIDSKKLSLETLFPEGLNIY
jgi:hypothetical protein